jgi:very-short-patch-repair endonuclease
MTVWFPAGFDPGALGTPRHRPGRSPRYHVDLVLAELASRQYGVVSRRQLLHLGITPGEMEARLRTGHLLAQRRGVYAVGHIPSVVSPAARMGAVLASGREARLGGWSGCTQRALLPEAGRRIDIAIPRDRRVVLPGVAVRRVAPGAGAWTVADGIPTHTVAQLLLDLASVPATAGAVERAWRQALFLGTLDIGDLQLLLAAQRGHPGTPQIRALFERRALLVGELRNGFEELMLAIIREAGLPEPLVNTSFEVGGGLVLKPDFRIPALRLIIESDGKDGHEDVEFLLSDTERTALYAAKGYVTQRWSYWEARRERARVRGALQAHRWGSAAAA